MKAPADETQFRLARADTYIANAEKPSPYVKEYPACPFELLSSDQAIPHRQAGFWVDDYDHQLGRLFDPWWNYSEEWKYLHGLPCSYAKEGMGFTFEDAWDFDYNEPRLVLEKRFTDNGYTYYLIDIKEWSSDNVGYLYLGAKRIAYGNKNGITWEIAYYGSDDEGDWHYVLEGPWHVPYSHRYTMRHSMQLGDHYLDIKGGKNIERIRNKLSQYGFTYDIYDPLFHCSISEADDYLFTNHAYHDCDFGIDWADNALPHAHYYYAYESKVCKDRGFYIWVSRRDRLCRILQAIHILNKYGDPNHSYPDPKGDGNITPRSVAEDMENNCWNGHGINTWGSGMFPGGPTDLASAVRTNAFLVLETLLGYKHELPHHESWADTCANVLLNAQWGIHNGQVRDGKGETEQWGDLLRPNHTGGCMVGWKVGSSYPYKHSVHESIFDAFNMPDEDIGAILTNLEATATYFQALRVYLHYAHGIDYASSDLIP
jgi:hypothetical protein